MKDFDCIYGKAVMVRDHQNRPVIGSLYVKSVEAGRPSFIGKANPTSRSHGQCP